MDAMDLEEWEFLSEEGFIDQLPNRKSKRVIPKGASLSPNLVIHVPVEFDFQIPESLEQPVQAANSTTPVPVLGSEPEQEPVSSQQVFFKKAIADMKLDSPKPLNREKDEAQKKKKTPKSSFDWNEPDQKDCDLDENHGGLNIWKMGMTGIGALCSFGFACATIFVIAVTTHRRENKNKNHSQKVYSDDKRMKEVVHHATKMNDAISALKGIPLSRAHIAIGGYFDGV